MKKQQKKNEATTVLAAINLLAVSLTDHKHVWTPRERRTYGKAVGIMERMIKASGKS